MTFGGRATQRHEMNGFAAVTTKKSRINTIIIWLLRRWWHTIDWRTTTLLFFFDTFTFKCALKKDVEDDKQSTKNTINAETTENEKVPIIVCMTALFDNNWCTMCTFCGCCAGWLAGCVCVVRFFIICGTHSHISMLIILFQWLKRLLLFIIIFSLEFVNLAVCLSVTSSNYSHFTLLIYYLHTQTLCCVWTCVFWPL